jgi:hypothetical protein
MRQILGSIAVDIILTTLAVMLGLLLRRVLHIQNKVLSIVLVCSIIFLTLLLKDAVLAWVK